MSRGQKGVGRRNGDGEMGKINGKMRKMRKMYGTMKECAEGTEKCGKISENAENAENGKHKRIEDKEWVQMRRKTD